MRLGIIFKFTMDTYTNSKGESMLIKDMECQHLVHSIAKLAKKLGVVDEIIVGEEERVEGEEMLKALKKEAIERMFVQE